MRTVRLMSYRRRCSPILFGQALIVSGERTRLACCLSRPRRKLALSAFTTLSSPLARVLPGTRKDGFPAVRIFGGWKAAVPASWSARKVRNLCQLSLAVFLYVAAASSPLSQSKAAEPLEKPARPAAGTVSGAFEFHEKSKLPLPAGYKLLYEQSFDGETALKDFVFTDPKAWKVAKDEKGAALELLTQSQYQPPVRSPVNIALIADKIFSDFILEADFIQTGREYGHRDMCIFFGMKDPAKFYYVHIATAADPNAHNIFIVNDKPRINIAKETTKGVNWGLGIWHKVHLERKLADGGIRVFFDDMTKPIMLAEEKTFGAGYIGFGSFDDTGKVDNIRIWGPSVETKAPDFFSRP